MKDVALYFKIVILHISTTCHTAINTEGSNYVY